MMVKLSHLHFWFWYWLRCQCISVLPTISPDQSPSHLTEVCDWGKERQEGVILITFNLHKVVVQQVLRIRKMVLNTMSNVQCPFNKSWCSFLLPTSCALAGSSGLWTKVFARNSLPANHHDHRRRKWKDNPESESVSLPSSERCEGTVGDWPIPTCDRSLDGQVARHCVSFA